MNESILTAFPVEEQKAFESLFSPGVSYYEKNEILNNGEMRVITNFNSVMQCTLVLKNADCNISSDAIEIHFEEAKLYRKDGRYFIDADYLSFENDDEKGALTIGFDSAEVQYEFFWHPDTYRSIGPWEDLFQLATDLKDKCDLAPAHCNDKEMALLPLLAELSLLSRYWDIKVPRFPHLKQWASERDFREIVLKLENLEKQNTQAMLEKHIRRLQNTLNDAKYEAVWRELFEKIQDSQADYPQAAAAPQQLALRETISKKMKENGYEGNYPDFYRVDNKLVYHVNFHDYYVENENASYNCYCGRMPLGKNGAVGDIRSCMFRDKNKRFFSEFYPYDLENGELLFQNLDKCLRLAIKIAEHQKFTKEEKKAIRTERMSPGFAIFLSFGLSVMIMVIAVLVLLLLACFITLMLIGPEGISEMLHEIPWWKYILGIFLGLWAALSVYCVKPKKIF